MTHEFTITVLDNFCHKCKVKAMTKPGAYTTCFILEDGTCLTVDDKQIETHELIAVGDNHFLKVTKGLA